MTSVKPLHQMPMKTYTISWGGHHLDLGRQTAIMGVVNVTPDSFSDGGKFYSCKDAVAHGLKLAKDGADIIDIGGESTRPFSDSVSEEEEIHRVVPVIKSLSKEISIPISIDTTKAGVAERAIEAGASLVNDISALRFDEKMAGVVSTYHVPVILMHMRGTPKTMQMSPRYEDIIKEMKAFFENAIDRAEKSRIPKSRIIVDPGIGFGKTVKQNLLLIQQLHQFHSLAAPILIGPSRKSFIRNILKNKNQHDIPPDSPMVETGTQAVVAAAVLNGAHMVRVHDVANTRTTIKMMDTLKSA